MKKDKSAEDAAAIKAAKDIFASGEIVRGDDGAPQLAERAEGDMPDGDKPQVYRASFSTEFEETLFRGFSRVLMHGKENVDLSFANDGAPILYSHNRSEVLGKITRAWIENKRGMCEFIFDSTEEAQKIKGQVDRGFLSRTSVGATILESTFEDLKMGGEIQRATKWRVNEVSLVAVPADDGVGVNRSEAEKTLAERGHHAPNSDTPTEKETSQMTTPTNPTTENPTTSVQITREEVRKEIAEATATAEKRAQDAERERVSEITRAAEIATTLPLSERSTLEREALRDGTSYADFLGKLSERTAQLQTENPGALNDPSKIGLSDKETRKFSVSRALSNFVAPDVVTDKDVGFERECLQANRSLANHGGIVLPYEILAAQSDGSGEVRRVQQIGGSTTGASLLETELRHQSFIQNLRDMAVTMRSGVQMLTGLRGTVDIPRKTKSATFSFKAEGANTGETDLTFDKITLSRKSASGAVGWTREMLLQAQPAIDAIIMQDLVLGAALLFDDAVLDGSGAANNPRGIINTDATNVASYTTANGMTWKQALAAETSLLADNVMMSNPAWFMTPAHRQALRSQPRMPVQGDLTAGAASGGGGFVVDDKNMLLGYPVYAKTMSIDSDKALLGVMSECCVGVWNMLEITRDTATNAQSGGVVLRAWVDMDVALKHLESFCVISGS